MQVGTSARRAAVAALAIMAGVSLPVATPARAATVPAYAAWTFGGSAGAYTGTMSLGPGFPAATFSSNSTSGAGTGLQTGASTWLPAGSPFGGVFGSSENLPYVNLRPAANNALSPSTTTFTFAAPIPAGSWAFALGDIDADLVQLSATDSGGNPVAAADLGFQAAFNYCDATRAERDLGYRPRDFTDTLRDTIVDLLDRGLATASTDKLRALVASKRANTGSR